MASNNDWIEKIKAVDPEAEIEGLTNKQLAALHKQLTEEQKEPEQKEPEQKEPEQKEPEQKEPERAPGYYVKPGCAITTKAGIKAGGARVTAEMVAGGAKALKALEGKHLEHVE